MILLTITCLVYLETYLPKAHPITTSKGVSLKHNNFKPIAVSGISRNCITCYDNSSLGNNLYNTVDLSGLGAEIGENGALGDFDRAAEFRERVVDTSEGFNGF